MINTETSGVRKETRERERETEIETDTETETETDKGSLTVGTKRQRQIYR